MSLYALRNQHGVICAHTVSDTKQECWGKSFDYVATFLGPEWERKYWKRWDASRMSAIREGFSIIKVKIVPASTTTKRQSAGVEKDG